MKNGQGGDAVTRILGITIIVAALLCGFAIIGAIVTHEESAKENRLRAASDHAVAFTTGLCATGGPFGAANYCADWTWVHQVGPYFYRCGLAMADSSRSIRHLRVAQFATKQEAVAGARPLNAVSCDMEKLVNADNDSRGWEIPALQEWANTED